MLKSAIVNYTIERSKLTTKKDILGLTLENKTRQQEARRVAWVAAVMRKIIIFANISPFMFVYPRHFHKGK